jgi:hypothetical protein
MKTSTFIFEKTPKNWLFSSSTSSQILARSSFGWLLHHIPHKSETKNHALDTKEK